jgi:hypothetical protein
LSKGQKLVVQMFFFQFLGIYESNGSNALRQVDIA